MNEHRHVFVHQGGGCHVGEVEHPERQCDDHYQCKCGAEFFTESNVDVHFAMPNKIYGSIAYETPLDQ